MSTRPGFFEGVVVAFGAASLASVLSVGLGLIVPQADLVYLMTLGIGLGYGGYLIARSGQRVGRIVTLMLWLGVSSSVAVLLPGLWPQVLAQLALIWLLRTLYFHATPTAAALDFGLVLLGLAAALWAGERTGSLFLVVWTLLLVQAVFPAIPGATAPSCSDRDDDAGFASAERAAARALGRLGDVD